MSLSSKILAKYLFLLLGLAILLFLTGVSPAYADDAGNNSTYDSAIQTDSNATDSMVQNIPGSPLSAISEPDPNNGMVPATALISDFTGTQTILSSLTFGTDQDVPAIWQDSLVWRSVFPDATNPQYRFSDLFLYTISSGECSRIGSNLSAVAVPDIWNDRIVWSSPENGTFEIFLYNISTNDVVRITDDSIDQVKPRIWGDHIVWQEGEDSDPETGVYLYTLGTGTTIQLDGDSGYAMSPSLWEDRIVWQDGRNGNDYDIYLYNCTSGIETQITQDPSWQSNPVIWKDIIVWEDSREPYLHLYMYDLVHGNESQITFGENDQISPEMYDNFVVYVNQSAIWLTDLSTMSVHKISGSDSIPSDPDIWDRRIIWTDNRNGDNDVFLFTIGVEKPPLLVDFTQNATQGEYPLTVAFTETTSGQVEGWHWDFGDDTNSCEKNPVHAYLVPGTYSVSLTVHNQWQRAGIVKEELISVNSEPLPQFSVNQTSGAAPFVVQFQDLSSGSPIAWKWQFGDGTSSDEQSPIHRYANPGIYEVSLSVSNIFGNATLKKPGLILVMDGTYLTCSLPSAGIEINHSESGPVLELNTMLAGNCTFNAETNSDLLFCFPGDESGIAQILFFSKDETEFSYKDNETITGTLGQVEVSSIDLVPKNYSQETGSIHHFNYTISLPDYPKEGRIDTVIWEGSTPEDLKIFNQICSDNHIVRVEKMAATVRFKEENIPDNKSAILIFGVSSDWVERYGWRWSSSIESDPSGAAVFVDNIYIGFTPVSIEAGYSPGTHTVTLKKSGYQDNVSSITIDDKRNHIHVIRIGDDGAGEVLNTTFIGHDPERNLDFFMAESPNGLSTFGLASLSKSGNLFRLLYLAIAQSVQAQTGGNGGGTSRGVTGLREPSTPVQTPTPGASVTYMPTIPQNGEDKGPRVTGSPTATKPPATPTEQPTNSTGGNGNGEVPAAMVLFRNLAVISAVMIITVIFYLRWKKEEE